MLENFPVEKKKNYLSLAKIASFRKGCKPTEKGRRSNAGLTLFAFEYENGIIFSCRYRSIDHLGTHFSDHFKYKLQLRKLKSGEIRFIFYNINPAGQQGVKTASPNHMRSKMMGICLDQERARKKPRTELIVRGLYAAQEKRLLAFVRAFLKRQGIPIKHLSKDPFSLMVQLCYPGAKNFDEQVLQKLTVGSLLLDDPVKLALRTKGKASKRLLLGSIKKFPNGSQTILRIAKYLRINRSLDEAQKFLELLNSVSSDDATSMNDDCGYKYSIKKLTAKDMKIFDPLSIQGIYRLATTHLGRVMVNDTFEMISQLNANNGFNVLAIHYRTMRELHNALVAIRPRRGGENQFTDYEFNQEKKPMQFCKVLAKNFKDEKYSVCYPAGTEELRNYASTMHNCAFYYHERIKRGEYAIFCFRKERLNFMFGVTFHTRRVMRGDQEWVSVPLVRADQAVGHCNKSIDRALEDRLNLKIEEAVKGSFAFWHRTSPIYENWLHQDFAQR